MSLKADRLKAQVAVITGAAQGIGRATALRLAADGAAAVVADINRPGAEEVAAEICAAGGKAIAHEVDVAVEAQMHELMERAASEFGRLDILHNNAARISGDWLDQDGDITKMTAQFWDDTLAINLRSVMFGCKYAIPVMLRTGGGSIINMASVHGAPSARGAIPAYGVSKAAIAHLTKCVAVQYGKKGIRCNAVAPGTILSPTIAAGLSAADVEDRTSLNLTPRVGVPDDVAAAVSFLASDEESGFVTGHILVVDGGRTVPFLGGFEDIDRPASSGQTHFFPAAQDGGKD